MPGSEAAEKNPSAGVTLSAPWRVTEVEVLPNYRIRVCFLDGTRGEVDMEPLLLGDRAGVFVVLRDPAVFSNAAVHLGVVTWPGDLDLAPDAMYRAIKRDGKWVP